MAEEVEEDTTPERPRHLVVKGEDPLLRGGESRFPRFNPALETRDPCDGSCTSGQNGPFAQYGDDAGSQKDCQSDYECQSIEPEGVWKRNSNADSSDSCQCNNRTRNNEQPAIQCHRT